MLTKQAKILNLEQIKLVLNYLESTRYPLKYKIIVLLSFHGLRACEIANLSVSSILDSTGLVSDSILVLNSASKGKNGGRIVYINQQLKSLLEDYLKQYDSTLQTYLINTERSSKYSANAIAVFFKLLYKKLGIIGASSHSGRRSFITSCAKKISSVGGSLRDVQQLAGHSSLSMTQRYIEQDSEAQKLVVEKMYS
jgi:integrase